MLASASSRSRTFATTLRCAARCRCLAERAVAARRRNQHARRVRSPEVARTRFLLSWPCNLIAACPEEFCSASCASPSSSSPFLVLLWWFGMRMPGKNVSKAGPLSPDEVDVARRAPRECAKARGRNRRAQHVALRTAQRRCRFHRRFFSRAGLRTATRQLRDARTSRATISRRKFRRQGAAVSVRRRSSSSARTMIRCLARRAQMITAAVSLQFWRWRNGSLLAKQNGIRRGRRPTKRCASLRL